MDIHQVEAKKQEAEQAATEKKEIKKKIDKDDRDFLNLLKTSHTNT